jgi:putative ABC transport system permease protein
MRRVPPRVAAWLLARLVPADEREWVLGDLEERWQARRDRDGGSAAALWYWSRAVTIPVWLWTAELRTTTWALRRELRTSLRTHARAPAAALTMVCTLALGIGAIASVLSVVDAVLLEPLPYPEADRVVTISHRVRGLSVDEVPSSSAAHVVYEPARSFEAMALYTVGDATVSATDAAPARVPVVRATRSLFRVLGVTPVLGRPFAEEEDVPGAARVVLLSERFWRSRYAGDAGVLGRTVTINGTAHEIVGVLPNAYAFPAPDIALLLPLRLDRSDLGGFNTPGIGRLRAGVTPSQAEGELVELLPRITSVVSFLTPAMLEDAGIRPVVRAYGDVVVGDARGPLLIVLAGMAFVLLIACVNVAHLLFVRAEGRRQELAVRLALGAGRAQLLGLFVAEAGVLALAGAALGTGMAYALLRFLLALAPPTLPRMETIALDGSVLGTLVVLTVGIALAFGTLTHRFVTRAETVATLRGGTRGATSGRASARMRHLLMATQVAFVTLLLVGSGLTVRSLDRLHQVDVGFRSDGILTFGLALPATDYARAEDVASFHRTFLERIEAMPGVEVAGLTAELPLGGFSTLIDPLSVRGRPSATDAVHPLAEMRLATPGYFEALGIPLLRGRALDWTDVETRSGAVVISERTSRHYFEGTDAIGQSVAHGLQGLPGARAFSDVVGVVGDVRGVSPFEEPIGAVYYTLLTGEGVDMDWLARSVTYVVRTDAEPLTLVPALQRLLATLDARLPMADVRTLDDVVAASRTRATFATWLLAIAAGLGLGLGAIGLYGVTSVAAARRTREIGVRIALGATPASVSRLIVWQGVGAAALGLAVGLGAAALLARFLRTLLFEVDGRDPATYATVALVLLAVAAAASWLPAVRAGRSDPRRALES